MSNAVKPPQTSPNQFLGSSMSRLFPEPLNDRVFPSSALFQDFLLRPPGGQKLQQPTPPPLFGGSAVPASLAGPLPSAVVAAMQDLPTELDTLGITTKVKEKLATHNLGQKVRKCISLDTGCIAQSDIN